MNQGEKFSAAMARVKLTQHDLAKSTGKHKRTVWRWQKNLSPVPDYAWTIVMMQKKIRELTAELCKQ